jgi:hypothetical protein
VLYRHLVRVFHSRNFLGNHGKKALVDSRYLAYSGRLSEIVLSSRLTPDTFNNRKVIKIGETMLHQKPEAAANRKNAHQMQNSPK